MADEQAPAGWYDDPEKPGLQRYWDGHAWAPATPPPPPPPAPEAAAAAPTMATPAPPAAPLRTTNGLAVASLVLGILWIWWLGSILAVIFGHVAKSQMSQPDNDQAGAGMATAGLILGYIGLGFLALVIVLAATSA